MARGGNAPDFAIHKLVLAAVEEHRVHQSNARQGMANNRANRLRGIHLNFDLDLHIPHAIDIIAQV